MKAYISAFKVSFMTLIQYRTSALSGCITQIFFGFIKILAFQAYYHSTTKVQPMNFEQMVSYVWLGQALFALIPLGGDYGFNDLIRSGNIVYELTRPVDIFGFWFSKQVAQRIVPTTLRCIPIILVSSILFPLIGEGEWALNAPDTIGAALLFLLSLIMAVIISTAFSLMLSVVMFWTISSEGIATLLPVVIWTFSGILLPLSFFPKIARDILQYLPFRGIMDIPFQIYVGSMTGCVALKAIMLQAVWGVTLLLVVRFFLNHGLKRVVVQGG